MRSPRLLALAIAVAFSLGASACEPRSAAPLSAEPTTVEPATPPPAQLGEAPRLPAAER